MEHCGFLNSNVYVLLCINRHCPPFVLLCGVILFYHYYMHVYARLQIDVLVLCCVHKLQHLKGST